MGFVARVYQPSTLRMLIWPEASSAQNNIAAVSADGMHAHRTGRHCRAALATLTGRRRPRVAAQASSYGSGPA